MTHPAAGTRPAPHELTDVPALLDAYVTRRPHADVPGERIAFGTSGHRGSALAGSFNEDHILAITQAICEYRASQGITGPLFLGADTHALSAPAHDTALEVLAANRVHVRITPAGDFVPTPALSFAILTHNAAHANAPADGIGITPSHNPPADGGFKYNPPHGGPADSDATKAIEQRANALLAAGLREVRRTSVRAARAAATVHDFRTPYVEALGDVLDLDVIRGSGLRAAVHPLGGAGVHYWPHIAERWRLPLTVLDTTVDPTFGFMTRDWDGKVRMDPSSAYAMAGVLEHAAPFDVVLAADTDHDRHGIIARTSGLLPANHYLAVCIHYLLAHRPEWRADIGIGKTIVSSSLIDRVVALHQRRLHEVPVGFKWFVPGLMDGSLGFVGEESAGATFLRRNGTVFTTDKDGLIAGLLACELTARTGRDPGEHYAALAEQLGAPVYARTDAPASREQKARLGALSGTDITARTLAGDPITDVRTHAPGNGAAIGGVKVSTAHGWFAARPSGTEDVYKIYAESFRGPEHLAELQREAQQLVDAVLAG